MKIQLLRSPNPLPVYREKPLLFKQNETALLLSQISMVDWSSIVHDKSFEEMDPYQSTIPLLALFRVTYCFISCGYIQLCIRIMKCYRIELSQGPVILRDEKFTVNSCS